MNAQAPANPIELPGVLVCGFPNSGTPFLCNLVAEMGFSPGPPGDLKEPDAHNRWGYWENVPIYHAVRQTVEAFGYHAHIAGSLPKRPPLLESDPVATEVRQLAAADGVEVYKDNRLPFVYTLFPTNAKCILIYRPSRAIYRSGSYRSADGLSFMEFKRAFDSYWDLARNHLMRERKSLLVGYDDFGFDFVRAVRRVAAFLEVELRRGDTARLRAVWRPRIRYHRAWAKRELH